MVFIAYYELLDFSEHAKSVLTKRLSQFFEIATNKALNGRAIILKPEFQWKVEQDEFGVKVLVVYKNGNLLNIRNLAGIFHIATDRRLRLRDEGIFKDCSFRITEKDDFNLLLFDSNSAKHIAFVDKSIDIEKGFKVLDYVWSDIDW